MKASDILNNHLLKRTSCREGIIETMMLANKALSENEIREGLVGNYDRTTFYRSFKTLEEHQIIHKIVVDNQLVKYAIGNTSSRHKNHVHFYCNQCHTVKCLDVVSDMNIQLPDGYTQTCVEIVIKGICVTCKQ